MIHLYARVSTQDQDLKTQLRLLNDAASKLDDSDIKLYTEKVSGKAKDRPEFDKLLIATRKGDVVLVTDIDRLGRSLTQLSATIDMFSSKGITLIATKQGIDTSTLTGRMMAGMVSVIAEFETGLRAERIKSGIETAKKSGKYRGRTPITDLVMQGIDNDIENNIPIAVACKKAGISRDTYYKRKKRSN